MKDLREKTLKVAQAIIKEDVAKEKALVFRRVLYSKLNNCGINLYKRRGNTNESLISFIEDEEVYILQSCFTQTMDEFGITTNKVQIIRSKKLDRNNHEDN